MKNFSTNKLKQQLVLAAISAIAVQSTFAAAFNWTNNVAGGADFTDSPGNWTNAATPFSTGTPGANDTALNNLAGSTMLIQSGDSVRVIQLQAGVGAVSITGGNLYTTNLQIVGNGGSISQSGGVVTNIGDARISLPNGTWNVSGGSFYLNKLVLGANAGTVNANMTISGSGQVFQNQPFLATGTLQDQLWIGGNNGGSGSLLLKDNSTWVNTSTALNDGSANPTIVVGNNSTGQGTFTIQDNATFIATNVIQVAQNSGNVGTVNLNGGTVNVNGFSKKAGTGTINFNGGTFKAQIDTNNIFSNFGGIGGNNSVNLLAGGMKIDSAGHSIGITNVLSGIGGLTKSGLGTLTLTGISTYTSNTIVNAGTLTLADNAGLKFVIGANGINNMIDGFGTLNLLGDFTFDLSGASTTAGDSWLIVNVGSLTVNFDALFSVNGFTENNNVWTSGAFQFNESDGKLSVIPEPTTMALASVGGGILLLVFRQRGRKGENCSKKH